MKHFLSWIGSFVRATRLPRVCEYFKRAYNYIYTGYIRKGFKSWGESTLILPYAMNIKGEDVISIGANTQLGKSIQLTAWKRYQDKEYQPTISIGDNCLIRDFAHITAINKIIIGNNLLTGTNVLITDNSHGFLSKDSVEVNPSKRDLVSSGPVYIGNNVWLGNNVTILPNVSIGNGVIIGANSVVTKDIPDNCVAAGVPAKVVKRLEL